VFSVAAVVSLALGIGANTAIFTLANAILLRPIAASDPQRLVRVAASEPGGRPGALLSPMVSLIRDDHVFNGLCGFLAPSNTVEIHGRVVPMATHALTGECFSTLGVGAAFGRVLVPDDDRAGSAHVVVLSYEFWRREYNGGGSAIGDTIDIEGTKHTVVGVAARGFDGLLVGYPTKLFFPLGNFEGGLAGAFPPPSLMPMEVIGRLRPAVTFESAAARVHARWQSWLDASVPSQLGPLQRDRYLHRQAHVTEAATGIDYSLRARFRAPLIALLAIAAVVLVAACLNVANLQLSRAADRARERVVRAALGASRADLVADAATESLLLLVLGFVAGVVVAYWVDHLLVSLFTASSTNFAIAIAPDARVLTFACALAVLAFIVFAIVPAARASRVDAAAIAGASHRVAGQRGRLREAAVVAQVALTIVLVAAGSIFVTGVHELRAAPLGFAVERLVAAQLTPLPGGYQNGFAPEPYYRSLLDRVKTLPGVESATLANAIPLTTFFLSVRVGVAGAPVETDADQSFVSSGFFATVGIPLVAGATFPPSGATARSVVVSESTAKALFGQADVVGRTVRIGLGPQMQALPIAAVAHDAIITNPQRGNTRVVYLNQSQFGPNVQEWPALIIREHAPRAVGFDAIERAVHDGGHEYVHHVRTLSDQRDIALAQERLLAAVATAFAAIGLALVAVGVFGLLSYAVTQRRTEIGVRLALGASRRHVAWLVIRQAFVLMALGTSLGLPAAFVAGRYAASALFARSIDTHATVAVIVTAMTAIATAAVAIPVRRAVALDPMQVLRGDI
jgi:predicted permease